MPWLMPSFGRPAAPRKLLDAPGGMPDDVWILVNDDDPQRDAYSEVIPPTWRVLIVAAGSRFADAVRTAFIRAPDEAFYGIIDDDYWPVTAGWHELMVQAAGPNGIAIANNRQNFPKPYCCRVMGGDLARAIGTLAPGKMKHNFSDDTWGRFGEDFGILQPLEHVIVEHRHHLFRPDVVKDATYSRGSGDFGQDSALYQDWLKSGERTEQYGRVAKLLGRTLTDLRKFHLAILVPMQDTSVDIAFHRSIHDTARLCLSRGLNLSIHQAAGGSHIGKARERVLWIANATPATHFLFIDDDMGWDPELVLRLLAADHDFCAAVGVRKIDDLSLCCNFLRGDQRLHPRTKFLEVKSVGFAFVMLKREVVTRMCEAYPELRYNTREAPPEWALFLDMIDTSEGTPGERLSEDYSFCQRWRAIGGEIWIDPDAALIHAGRKEYTGRPRDVLREVEAANQGANDESGRISASAVRAA